MNRAARYTHFSISGFCSSDLCESIVISLCGIPFVDLKVRVLEELITRTINLIFALAFLSTLAIGSCMLLAVLFSGTTTSVKDLMLTSQQITAVYAQPTDHTAHSTTSSSSEGLDATIENDTNSTFSARGLISSLIITVPESRFNITNAFKVILTGGWNLSVSNGNITDLAISFIASPMDGSRQHIHRITDFRPYNNEEPIRLSIDDSLSLNGTADIKINDTVAWENADVSILISKGKTFTFDPDDIDTENHFGDQQVYGVVARLIT